MVENKAEDMWLPYGGIIMDILEHIEFDLEGEEPSKEYIGIGRQMLNQIWIDIKDRVQKKNL